MPGKGQCAVQGILSASPSTRVVGLSAADDAASSPKMLRAGDGSYIVKGASPDEILAVVLRSASSESFLSAEVAGGVLGELSAHLEHRDMDEVEARRRKDQIASVIDHAVYALCSSRSLTSRLGDGVRFAIDDAGAGFASFRHVIELAPDYVKLDVSLTRGIDQDRRRRAFAHRLNGFANELGIAIVAEGVERRAELDTLSELGISLGQGHLWNIHACEHPRC